MGGIEPAPVAPAPCLLGTTLCGDRIAAAFSLLDHSRL